jgi:hypothetical protein
MWAEICNVLQQSRLASVAVGFAAGAVIGGALGALTVIAVATSAGAREVAVPPPADTTPAAPTLAAAPSEDDRALAEIAQIQWRLARRVRTMRRANASDGPLRHDLRQFEAYARSLAMQLGKLGIDLVDLTGWPYDPGLDVELVSQEERPDLTEPAIIETVVPSVRRGDAVLVRAAVVVGCPAKNGPPHAGGTDQ